MEGLPSDLLATIFEHVAVLDLCALRLVCKRLQLVIEQKQLFRRHLLRIGLVYCVRHLRFESISRGMYAINLEDIPRDERKYYSHDFMYGKSGFFWFRNGQTLGLLRWNCIKIWIEYPNMDIYEPHFGIFNAAEMDKSVLILTQDEELLQFTCAGFFKKLMSKVILLTEKRRKHAYIMDVECRLYAVVEMPESGKIIFIGTPHHCGLAKYEFVGDYIFILDDDGNLYRAIFAANKWSLCRICVPDNIKLRHMSLHYFFSDMHLAEKEDANDFLLCLIK